MPLDPLEVDDAGVIRDRYGRRVIKNSVKHAAPDPSDVPTSAGLTDSYGKELVVIEGVAVATDPSSPVVVGPSTDIAALLAGKQDFGSTTRTVNLSPVAGVRQVPLSPGDTVVKVTGAGPLTNNLTLTFAGPSSGILVDLVLIYLDFVQPPAPPFYTLTLPQVSGAVPALGQAASARTRVQLFFDGVNVSAPGITNTSTPSSMTTTTTAFAAGT